MGHRAIVLFRVDPLSDNGFTSPFSTSDLGWALSSVDYLLTIAMKPYRVPYPSAPRCYAVLSWLGGRTCGQDSLCVAKTQTPRLGSRRTKGPLAVANILFPDPFQTSSQAGFALKPL